MKRAFWCTGLFCALLPQTTLADASASHGASDDLQAAREALHHHMGGQQIPMGFVDRLEYRSNEGDAQLLWDVQASHGGDINRLVLKSEGEVALDDRETEAAEIQALYSRAVSPYFDLQAGVRYDPDPQPDRYSAVLGFQGLAPYWFEVDAAAFVSERGDVSARLEVEYDLLLTQRLILQPRVELDAALQDVPELGRGSGLGGVAAGLRLRYEIRREFAPYVGIEWERALGDTADFRRADGDSVSRLSWVAGIRCWF